MKALRFLFGFGLLALCWQPACAGEDPIEAVRSFAGVEDIQPEALKKGQVYSRAAGVDGVSRGVFTEVVWWMKGTPEALAKIVIDGLPGKGKPGIYRSIRSGSVAPADFAAVKLDPAKDRDRWLIDETAKAEGLFISAKEIREVHDTVEKAGKEGRTAAVEAAWRRLLQVRCERFLRAGLKGIPPVDSGNALISADGEIRELVGAFGKVQKRFGKTLADTLFSRTPVQPILWWDLSEVNNHTSPSAGAYFTVPGPDSLRIIDVTFFSGSTYYFSVSLYEAWAWNGGTLVWRQDILSVPFRSYSLGVDRGIASKMMGSEVREQIKEWQK